LTVLIDWQILIFIATGELGRGWKF
jgi:hypothetical protein